MVLSKQYWASCPVARGASMGGVWRRVMLFEEDSAGCGILPQSKVEVQSLQERPRQ